MSQSESILDSWVINADNWIAAIDHAEIESRRLGTNQAIVDTVLSYAIESIIDIGCGEGWLTRTLRQQGKTAYGVDAVPGLVRNAIEKDGDFYQLCSYQALAKGEQLALDAFDGAVMNFSLLDKDDTAALVNALHRYLATNGLVFIQTLHATAVSGGHGSGWQEGSWKGLRPNFTRPYQWYFRTLEDWLELFKEGGLTIREIKEPLHPETQQPMSYIFVLQL